MTCIVGLQKRATRLRTRGRRGGGGVEPIWNALSIPEMCELMRRSLNSFASQPTVLRLSHTTAAGNIHVHGEDMTNANYSQPLLSRLPVMWFKGVDCAACGFCSITARSSAHYDLSRIHIVLLNLVTLHPQLSQTSIQWHFLFSSCQLRTSIVQSLKDGR